VIIDDSSCIDLIIVSWADIGPPGQYSVLGPIH